MIINERNNLNESMLSDLVKEIKKHYPQLKPHVFHRSNMGNIEIKDIPTELVDRIHRLADHIAKKNNVEIVYKNNPDGVYGKNNYLSMSFQEGISNKSKRMNEYEKVQIGWAKEPIDKVLKMLKNDNYKLYTDRGMKGMQYYIGRSKDDPYSFEIEKSTYDKLNKVTKNKYLIEDTVKKSNGKWTNKGKEGEHGEFDSKEKADAQRKAMFANGYRG